MSGAALVVAALVGLAVALARPGSSRRRSQARLAGVLLPPAEAPGSPAASRGRRVWLATGAAALAAVVLFPGPLGVLIGLVLTALLPRWLRSLESTSARQRRLAREAELPQVLEVLAACLVAGAAPQRAIDTVARSARSSLADDLAVASRALSAGASLGEAWRGLPDDVKVVGQVLAHSASSGAAAGPLLRTTATELRADRRATRLEASRRLGVRAAAPLGLCFLPGFVVLGLVPVVVGLVAGLR